MLFASFMGGVPSGLADASGPNLAVGSTAVPSAPLPLTTAAAVIPNPFGNVLILDLGTPEATGALTQASIPDCAVAPPGVLCYDVISPAAFQTALDPLNGYAVFLVGWTYTGRGNDADAMTALNFRSNYIANWVLNGGGLVAYAEFDVATSPAHWTWIPGGLLNIAYAAEHADDVKPVLPNHPSYAVQTEDTLSNWENSRHNYFTAWPSYLTPIATDSTETKVVSLAGSSGSGCVFITGQDPDWHSHYAGSTAATMLVRTSVGWANGCGSVSVPTAISRVLAIDQGLLETPGSLQNAGIPDCSTAPPLTLCYDLVSPTAFLTTPLDFYTVLFVGWTWGGDPNAVSALATRSNDIEAFVLSGGGVVAYSEMPGQWTWVPGGGAIAAFDEHAEDILLTAAGAAHPTHAGQTSVSLSNWGNSRHNYFTAWPLYLTPLSTDNSGVKTVSLAGPYGLGCVFITGQDPDWHSYWAANSAATLLVKTTVEWADGCS